MLGIQSIGIKQPGRVGKIKYPFSDVVGVAGVIARNGRERAGLLKSVHGEPVSLAVSNAAYESMETQTVGLFGQQDRRHREASIHKTGCRKFDRETEDPSLPQSDIENPAFEPRPYIPARQSPRPHPAHASGGYPPTPWS